MFFVELWSQEQSWCQPGNERSPETGLSWARSVCALGSGPGAGSARRAALCWWSRSRPRPSAQCTGRAAALCLHRGTRGTAIPASCQDSLPRSKIRESDCVKKYTNPPMSSELDFMGGCSRSLLCSCLCTGTAAWFNKLQLSLVS